MNFVQHSMSSANIKNAASQGIVLVANSNGSHKMQEINFANSKMKWYSKKE